MVLIRSDRTKSYHFFSLRTSARVTVVFRKHLYISTFRTLVEKCLGEILPAGSFHVEFLAKQRAPADSFFLLAFFTFFFLLAFLKLEFKFYRYNRNLYIKKNGTKRKSWLKGVSKSRSVSISLREVSLKLSSITAE